MKTQRKSASMVLVVTFLLLAVFTQYGVAFATDESTTMAIKINFQPQGTEIPEGYLPDYGEAYADRNGYTYGWNLGFTTATRHRGINSDPKLDTLIHFYSHGKWEIKVPNGLYDVTVGVGDAGAVSTPTLNVEGVNYWSGVSLKANQFLEETKTVAVSDGKITIDNGKTADQLTKINYVEIIKTVARNSSINLQAIPEEESVTLTWDSIAPGYEIEADGKLYATLGTSFTDYWLEPTTQHTYRIRPGAGTWVGDWSETLTVTTLPEALGTIKINFQLQGSDIPQGYIPDYGEVYGLRNGYTYGWNLGFETATRDRGIHPIQKLDTLIHFFHHGVWEFEVENGTYDVAVCIGDAEFACRPTVNVEGVNYWSGVSLDANQFLQQKNTVVVTDGKITIDNGGTEDLMTKINYVKILKK